MGLCLRASVEIDGPAGKRSWEHVFRTSPVRITRGDPQTIRSPGHLPVPLPFVSSRHADISFDPDGVFYQDVASTNPTMLGETSLKGTSRVSVPPDQPVTMEGNDQVLRIFLRTDQEEAAPIDDAGATIVDQVAPPQSDLVNQIDASQIRRLALLVRYSCAGIYDLIDTHRIRQRRVGFSSLVSKSGLYERRNAYDVEAWLQKVSEAELKQALVALYQDVRIDCVAVPKAAATAARKTFRSLSLRGRLSRLPLIGPLFRKWLERPAPQDDTFDSTFSTAFKAAYLEQQKVPPRIAGVEHTGLPAPASSERS